MMCNYIILGVVIVSATGYQGLQQENVFEVLVNGINNSSGIKLTECENAFRKMDFAKDWTKAMFDATSKLQSGILVGNAYELGTYDECLLIYDEADKVKGKYCLGTIDIINSTALIQRYVVIHSENNKTGTSDAGYTSNLALRWSICVPDVCMADDINKHLQEFNLDFLSFEEEACQTIATQPTLNTGDYCVIAFFAILGFIMLVSTLYDFSLYYQKKETSHPSLLSFSIFTNGRNLFKTSDSPNNLQCVSGIRSISMMWVVLGHVFLYWGMVPQTNLMDMQQWSMSPDSMYIIGASVSMDTFFLLGGMLVVYVYLGNKSDLKLLQIPAYYLHRYLRLTPVLAVVVLTNATLINKIGSGPIWNSPKNIVPMSFCKDYWWSTLLYIQNYVNSEKMCIPISWYLAIDMQLFILSPLILIPLKKYTKTTLGTVILLACGSVFAAVCINWYYKFNALYQAPGDLSYFTKYYMVPWTRAAPWLIGIILGYYVNQVKNIRSIKLNKLLVVILWIAALTILCVCVFCGNEIKTSKNVTATTTYTSLVRPVWAIALSWVVFACVSGYGGLINSFLSLPIFQILSKVSYSIYLTHYTILCIIFFSIRAPLRFSNLSVMGHFWCYFMLTLFVSAVFTLAFETPVIVIEKAIKKRGRTTQNNSLLTKATPQV